MARAGALRQDGGWVATRTIKALQAYDPELILRLTAIRRSVERGDASPETQVLWRALQDSVLVLVAERSGPSARTLSGRDVQDIRAWLIGFANTHWPATTVH